MRALRWIAVAIAMTMAGAWGPSTFPAAFGQATEDAGAFELDDTAPESPVSSNAADEEPNPLIRNLKAAGFIGAVIGCLSLTAVGFIIEHFVTIRKARIAPELPLHDLERMIEEGRIDEAIDYCDQPEVQSVATNVIQAGLERFRSSEFGFADYKYAVEEAGEDETGRLYRKTEALGVIAAVAPMLGLLGTVSGMIGAFNTIAEQEGGARPDELSGSIGEALVCTFLGLCVAVPSTIFFSYFRNRIDALVALTGKRVERVLAPLGKRR
jgi:biopolymer transport protein ExbB